MKTSMFALCIACLIAAASALDAHAIGSATKVSSLNVPHHIVAPALARACPALLRAGWVSPHTHRPRAIMTGIT